MKLKGPGEVFGLLIIKKVKKNIFLKKKLHMWRPRVH